MNDRALYESYRDECAKCRGNCGVCIMGEYHREMEAKQKREQQPTIETLTHENHQLREAIRAIVDTTGKLKGSPRLTEETYQLFVEQGDAIDAAAELLGESNG